MIMSEATRKYRQSDRYKASKKRYQRSIKGKITQKRYQQSDKGRISSRKASLKFIHTEKGLIARKQKYQRLLLSLYNLSLEDYTKLMEQQNGKCKICNRDFSIDYKHYACIDHNHTTGKIRGILCRACNSALGIFEDNIERLLCAIKYLEENN